MGKKLKKIYKQEAETLRLLENQKAELAKAIEENVKLIQDELEEESPAEMKIRQEIEDLTERVGLLNTQLTKVITRIESTYINNGLKELPNC